MAAPLSGLVTEASWRQWRPADFTLYLDVALEAFGPERLMIGSDWPVCNLTRDLATWTRLLDEILSGSSADELARLHHRNAREIYQLKPLA